METNILLLKAEYIDLLRMHNPLDYQLNKRISSNFAYGLVKIKKNFVY